MSEAEIAHHTHTQRLMVNAFSVLTTLRKTCSDHIPKDRFFVAVETVLSCSKFPPGLKGYPISGFAQLCRTDEISLKSPHTQTQGLGTGISSTSSHSRFSSLGAEVSFQWSSQCCSVLWSSFSIVKISCGPAPTVEHVLRKHSQVCLPLLVL